jgi:hypothetical protein
MRSLRWVVFLGIAVFLASPSSVFSRTQQPAQPVTPAAPTPPVAPSSQPPATPAQKKGKQKHSHANDFLLVGTVFNEKALSFPAVQLRIRRSGEKKFRWEASTNSRGDFAVRVPQGPEYEIVVHAKGFTDQTRTVSTSISDTQARISFQMEPLAGGKK